MEKFEVFNHRSYANFHTWRAGENSIGWWRTGPNREERGGAPARSWFITARLTASWLTVFRDAAGPGSLGTGLNDAVLIKRHSSADALFMNRQGVRDAHFLPPSWTHHPRPQGAHDCGSKTPSPRVLCRVVGVFWN